MDYDDARQRINERRLRQGMKPGTLANLAEVDRGRLADFLADRGNVRPTEVWLHRVEAALDRFEEETGDDFTPQAPDFVEFDVSGDFGVHVIVKGPISDADQLRHQVTELIREIRTDKSRGTTD